MCSTPFWSDLIGGSKPEPGCSDITKCNTHFFYKKKKLSRPIPWFDPNDRSELEPSFLRPFTLPYQNVSFMSFHFRVSNAQKLFQMVGYKHLSLYNTFTKWHVMLLKNDIQNTTSDINSFVHKISHVQKK